MQNGKSSKDIKEIQLKPTLQRERKSKEVLHCWNNAGYRDQGRGGDQPGAAGQCEHFMKIAND